MFGQFLDAVDISGKRRFKQGGGELLRLFFIAGFFLVENRFAGTEIVGAILRNGDIEFGFIPFLGHRVQLLLHFGNALAGGLDLRCQATLLRRVEIMHNRERPHAVGVRGVAPLRYQALLHQGFVHHMARYFSRGLQTPDTDTCQQRQQA